jgi:uncharacterized cupredoxin-like copper-binding protein
MKMRLAFALVALLLAAPAAAQEPEWRAAAEYDVLVSPFDYEPETIRLEAGRPVKLRFVNQGRGTYSFAAPDFFAAARLRSGDAEHVAGGKLVLAPGERRTIALVPAPGRYRARSGNLVHRLLGMSAEIVVE